MVFFYFSILFVVMIDRGEDKYSLLDRYENNVK